MRALKRAGKILSYTLAIIIAGILLLAGFTQTSFFKDRLRTILVSSISTELNGSLTLGSIDGNFLTGFTIDSIEVYQGTDLFLSSSKVSCSYDLLPALRDQYNITHFIIEQPTIHFRRSRAGVWNIGKLFLASEDSGSGSFKGILSLEDVQLKNATISLLDSSSLDNTPDSGAGNEFNYKNFTLRDINIQLDATLKDNDIHLSVSHISCYSTAPRFDLSHFKGDFSLNEHSVQARNVIIQSNTSYLEVDAFLKGVNVFEGLELSALEKDSSSVKVKATNIDFGELKTFLPPVYFLHGAASLDLEAGGEFGNLNVKKLEIRTHRSLLNLSGYVRNLHNPQELSLDVTAKNNKIFLADLSRLMPEFGIPEFENAGEATLFTQFEGKPLDFSTRTSVKGIFGEIDVAGNLDLTKPIPSYAVAFSTKQLSVGTLLPLPELRSSITATGTIEGAGFTLNDLATTLDATFDTTRIQHLEFVSSKLNISALEKKFDVTSTIGGYNMSAIVSGEADFTLPDKPVINGKADLTSIDLGAIFNEPKYSSNITLTGSFLGSGTTIDDASGTVRFYLKPSTFGGKEISEQEVNFSLDQHDPRNKVLTLTSDIADADIRGDFNLEQAIDALARQSANLVTAIRDHASSSDSVLGFRKKTVPPAVSTTLPVIMDFSYSVNVKNLSPVSVLFEGPKFDARAQLSGAVQGTSNLLSFSCKGSMDHLFVGTIDSGVIFNDATIDLNVTSLSVYRTLEQLSGNLKLDIGSSLLNGRTVDSAVVDLTYDKLKGKLSFTGILDSALKIVTEGQTSVQPHTYAFDVENLTIGNDVYRWKNNQDVQFRLNAEGIRIMRAVMQQNDEEFSLSGILRHNGEFDMQANLRNFDLRGINRWIPGENTGREGRGFSGNVNADILLRGTTSSPEISLRLNADETYFRKSRIGNVNASIDYLNETATINILTNDAKIDTVPDLRVTGTVPIDLAFTGVERRFPDREQQLEIRSDGFDLSVIDPLIWELDQLTGKLSCVVTVGGTPRSPEYHGSIALKDLRFLFMPNNVSYTANGELEPSGDKLTLKNLIVNNVPEDRAPGEARFEGSISIKDYAIASFDITMFGKLLVMNDASRKVIPTLYGRLFTQPDERGLNFSGTLKRPYLSGNLEVLDADIVFPPARLYEGNSKNSLTYVIIDDTSKAKIVPSKFPRSFYSAADTQRTSQRQRNASDELTLLDLLRYNLTIETKGTTAIKMIFTPSEELYSELEGKVTAINDQGTANIYGEIAVSPRSYYNFLKKFDASGTLKFVGPWDNPELNIKATYEGYRQVSGSDLPESGYDNATTKQLKAVVLLDIGGTRYEPKLTMSMSVQREPGGELVDWSTQARGGDVQSDIISFILTGKFKDDLTSNERNDIATSVGASTTTTVVSGFTSTLLSGILDEFIRKEFPFIRSVDVSYQDGTPSVNVGASPGLGYLRVGGRILNNLNNTNVSYQVNLGDIFNSPTIRNLFLEIQRRVENDLTETNREDVTNEARLYYRFSF
jgi:hypothetical protein